jgi:hypothetical protein
MIKNVFWSSLLLFIPDTNAPDRFSKNTQIRNFTNIHPVGTEMLLRTDTDRHGEANSSFSQFCERA